MKPSVAVIIPSIPPRARMLARAIQSVHEQTYQGRVEVLSWVDLERRGPANVRNDLVVRAKADTDYFAFLDDDDEFYPNHIEVLVQAAQDTGADLVYPWFDVVGPAGQPWFDPLSLHDKPVLGQEFDPDALRLSNYIPVTNLIRVETLLNVGGFVVPGSDDWPHADCEDWGTWLRLLDAGAKFHHVPERTWRWHHHGRNTSGQPGRW